MGDQFTVCPVRQRIKKRRIDEPSCQAANIPPILMNGPVRDAIAGELNPIVEETFP